MPHWMLKAAAQGAISRMPWSNSINRLLQNHVTKSLLLTPQLFEKQLHLCKTHLGNFHSVVGSDDSPSGVLELGTGWYPTVPIGLYLCGAADIWTIDKVRLLDGRGVLRVVYLFADYARTGALTQHLPGVLQARVETLEDAFHDDERSSPAAALEQLGIHPVVGDVCRLQFNTSSIDLFVSNNTLEHIPAGVLRRILFRFRGLASPDAVMSHFIDLSDHYAQFDPFISDLNFLKYSDRAWRLCNNSLHYQNRLRMSDYRRTHESAGFEILFEKNRRDPSALASTTRLAKRFQSIPAEELQITESWIVSVPDDSRFGGRVQPEVDPDIYGSGAWQTLGECS